MQITSTLKSIFYLTFIFVNTALFSQPVNDDCANAIDLAVIPYCNQSVFTNKNATASDIPTVPDCFVNDTPKRDVWFTFQTNSPDDLRITIAGNDQNGTMLNNIELAVYRGSCGANAMVLRDCVVSDAGESVLELKIGGLTLGEVYYLRIDNFGGEENAGDFDICIEENRTFNIKEDNFSTKCSGTLYDSGGEKNNYSDNEDYTFTICPEGDVNSIEYEFEYYNLNLINEGEFEYDTVPDIDKKNGDFLRLYNGIDTTYSVFLEVNGNAEMYFEENLIFGAGVRYKNCINSPCITLRFVSDDSLNAAGFKFAWNCKSGFCDVSEEAKLKVKSQVGVDSVLKYIVQKGVEGNMTSINCDDRAYGIFENTSDDIGFDKGIVMTNGLAENAIGPNDSGKKSFALKLPGDSDLDSLSAITEGVKWEKSHDACTMEFDIIPFGEEISYKYMFGSEEYHEFVNNKYNDIFALFISGNDIAGDFRLNNQRNMALVPESNDFVSINTVNGVKNWQYYHSNLDGKDLQYDGMVWDSLGKKHYLVARQKVTPCEVYHLKYAIADRADTIYDSGVFIGDLTDGRPELTLKLNYGFDYLSDNCSLLDGEVKFTLPFALEKDVRFDIEISGTAKRDIDYMSEIPDYIKFKAGELEKSFKVKAITDTLDEGIEYILIRLVRDLPCGRKVLGELVIEIHDNLDLRINGGLDTLYHCSTGIVKLKAEGMDYVHWSPGQYFDNPDTSEVSFNPVKNEWIYVQGRLIDTITDKCTAIDSIYIEDSQSDFNIEGDPVRLFCEGNVEKIFVNYRDKNAFLTWFPEDFIKGSIHNDSVNIMIDSSDFVLYCRLQSNGCDLVDSVIIHSSKAPELDITIDPEDNIRFCDTVSLTAEYYSGFDSGDTLLWDIAGEYFTEDERTINLVVDREKIIVQLQLIDSIGCNVFRDTLVYASNPEILFPNAIFPDDEKNKIFRPFNLSSCMKIEKFTIFDRWGEELFNCSDMSCAKEGWDSTFRGEAVKPGVYLYLFRYLDVDRKSKQIKGSFVVLK